MCNNSNVKTLKIIKKVISALFVLEKIKFEEKKISLNIFCIILEINLS